MLPKGPDRDAATADRGPPGVRVLLLGERLPDPGAMDGISLHLAALASHAPEGVAVFTAAPRGGSLRVEAWSPRRVVASLPLEGGGDGLRTAVEAALAGTGAHVLHVHSPLLGAEPLARAARASGVGVVVTLHDHSLVCENYELLEGGKRYCGIPTDPARCDVCLHRTRGRSPGAVSIHRASMRALVDVTDAFVAPSESVLALAARVHPVVRERARRIDWGVPLPEMRSVRSAGGPGPLRVAVVGVFASVKGAERLGELFEACRGLDVEWHLFGATEGKPLGELALRAERVVRDGAYRRHALASRLSAAGCHLVLLPSVGAESFSLVLSEVTAAGFPVIASHLGALGDRVQAEHLGWTFDPWNADEFGALVAHLAGDRAAIDRVAQSVRSRAVRTEADMAGDHAALWREVAARRSPVAVTERAREDFERGRPRGGAALRLERLLARLRQSDFYRDLPLRRMLPETMRLRLEQRALRWLGRSGRR